MGGLPWDDWFYKLPWKRDRVNSKHDLIVKTQDTVQADVLAFNEKLKKLKQLLVNNGLLLYISTTTQLDDLKLSEFSVQVDALSPPVKGDTVLNAAEAISELIGGIAVVKFVVNLAKLAKQAIVGGSEEVAAGTTEKVAESLAEDALDAGIVSVEETAATASLETSAEGAAEGATEAMVEGATSATLASTGVGIFLAVGLDALFGAINGAKEEKELDRILSALDAKMKIVNTYLDKVNKKSTEVNQKIVDNIKTFQKVASEMKKLLPTGHKPTFSVDFPATLESVDTCLDYQDKAITQFSLLAQLRVSYGKALKRNPNVNKEAVINAVLLTAPDWADYNTLKLMWDEVLAKYSTLMAKAN